MRLKIPHLRVGALAGLGSGLLALGLELATHGAHDGGARLVAVLMATLLPTFVLVGATLGALLALLSGAARALARGPLKRREPLALALLCSLLVAPVLYLLLARMAEGRRAAAVLGPLWVRLGIITVVVALLALLVHAGLRLAQRLASRRSRPLGLGVSALLFATAVVLFLADAQLYRRLYLYLHNVLLLAYLVAGMLACLALALTLSWRPRIPGGPWARRGLALAGIALLALSAAWARRELSADQRLRFAALEQTTATANVLTLAPLKVKGEAPLFLQSSLPRRARVSRETHRVPKANVVLVTVDALRADHLGAYGYGRPTSPNIDALAQRSVRFDKAYCQAPLTCYSVPSLLTGDYLRSTLPLVSKAPPTLARMLRARGYTTAAFYNASIFFCDDRRATAYGDRKFGFGYAETTLRPAGELTDHVLRYLERHGQSGGGPLFLWVHFFDVHEPYHRHPEYDYGARDVDRYDSEITHVDSAVGRLVAGLHQLRGPTIFVLSSDHGEEFKEHGGNYHGSSLYEEQIRVPLILAVPGIKPRVIRTPVQSVDIVPTVLSLLGLRQPESVRGESLVPELLGKGSPDRAAFSEVHTKKMVRFRNWKLIHDFRRSTYELYDLLTDPHERTNLIGRRPQDGARLKGLLYSWFDRLRNLTSQESEERPEGIDLGRIGDRRSVPLLDRLLLHPLAESRWRQEAARLLGQMQDRRAIPALWTASGSDDPRVAAEAAIALGELKHRPVRLVLPAVVQNTDAELRMRAGIALARVDSPLATPALVEALYGDNWEIQNRAAHYLGFVGDRSAIDPLIRLSRQLHLRSRIALALGRIGRRIKDRRILKLLLHLAQTDRSAEVKQKALGGLGFLGDRRAIRPLARLLARNRDLSWTPETLSRLGGIGWYQVPGLDFSTRRRGLRDGWGRCVTNRSSSTDDYLNSTWCAMNRVKARLLLSLQRKPFAAQLMLRLRALAPLMNGQQLTVVLNGRALRPIRITSGWRAVRFPTAARLWRKGKNQLELRLSRPTSTAGSMPSELVALDYIILAAQARGAARTAKATP